MNTCLKAAFSAILFVAIISTGPGAGIGHTEIYVCRAESDEEAVCEVDYKSLQDNRIDFHCRAGEGQPAATKTCRAVYTPIPNYTYTGLPGRNWVCESSLTAAHAEFENKKDMCSKLCQPCTNGWQLKQP